MPSVMRLRPVRLLCVARRRTCRAIMCTAPMGVCACVCACVWLGVAVISGLIVLCAVCTRLPPCATHSGATCAIHHGTGCGRCDGKCTCALLFATTTRTYAHTTHAEIHAPSVWASLEHASVNPKHVWCVAHHARYGRRVSATSLKMHAPETRPVQCTITSVIACSA